MFVLLLWVLHTLLNVLLVKLKVDIQSAKNLYLDEGYEIADKKKREDPWLQTNTESDILRVHAHPKRLHSMVNIIHNLRKLTTIGRTILSFCSGSSDRVVWLSWARYGFCGISWTAWTVNLVRQSVAKLVTFSSKWTHIICTGWTVVIHVSISQKLAMYIWFLT